jgi:hypothetical protein
MAQATPEEPRELFDPLNFEHQVKEYSQIRDSIAMLETRKKEIHAKLTEKLDLEGEEDSNGNIVYTLPEPIAGIAALVKNRRVSRKLNEERALEIIKEHDLEDELIELKPTVIEDAVMAALYEDKLTENEVDQMFPATVTWALTTKK